MSEQLQVEGLPPPPAPPEQSVTESTKTYQYFRDYVQTSMPKCLGAPKTIVEPLAIKKVKAMQASHDAFMAWMLGDTENRWKTIELTEQNFSAEVQTQLSMKSTIYEVREFGLYVKKRIELPSGAYILVTHQPSSDYSSGTLGFIYVPAFNAKTLNHFLRPGSAKQYLETLSKLTGQLADRFDVLKVGTKIKMLASDAGTLEYILKDLAGAVQRRAERIASGRGESDFGLFKKWLSESINKELDDARNSRSLDSLYREDTRINQYLPSRMVSCLMSLAEVYPKLVDTDIKDHAAFHAISSVAEEKYMLLRVTRLAANGGGMSKVDPQFATVRMNHFPISS